MKTRSANVTVSFSFLGTVDLCVEASIGSTQSEILELAVEMVEGLTPTAILAMDSHWDNSEVGDVEVQEEEEPPRRYRLWKS
jgi:hypothetical protein